MIIDELKQYLAEHKMTQEQMATKLGVSFTTLNRWLNGKYEPSKLAVEKIERLLRKK